MRHAIALSIGFVRESFFNILEQIENTILEQILGKKSISSLDLFQSFHINSILSSLTTSVFARVSDASKSYTGSLKVSMTNPMKVVLLLIGCISSQDPEVAASACAIVILLERSQIDL
jgi:hypothetical protein